MTLTAQVTGQAPGGLVSFFAGTTLLGTAKVSNGQAVLVTSYLSIGADVVVSASYGGDASNAVAITNAGPHVQVVAGAQPVSPPATTQFSVTPGDASLVGLPFLFYPSDSAVAVFSVFENGTLIGSYIDDRTLAPKRCRRPIGSDREVPVRDLLSSVRLSAARSRSRLRRAGRGSNQFAGECFLLERRLNF